MTTTAPMDAATVDLLTGSLREMFKTPPADLGRALDELGWDDAAAENPAQATQLLFAEHGRALMTSALLDRVVVAQLGDRRVAYPVRGGHVLLADPATVDEIVTLGDSPTVVPSGSVAAAPAHGFGTGWWFTDTIECGAPTDLVVDIGAGRRAVASELIGLCTAALGAATAHATTRRQYGRAIGSFQAVRHRLSESHVAVTAAREVLALAEADRADSTALLAKMRAGQAQADVMRNVIQFFGAIGISAESEIPLYVSRAGALDLVLGDHTALATQLGRELLTDGELEPVVLI